MRLRALWALVLSLALAACGGPPNVVYKDGEVRASGWRGPQPAQGWASVLKVYAGDQRQQPMLGEYRKVGSTIRFRPRFAPKPGLEMVAVYRPGPGVVERRFRQAGVSAATAPTVLSISPQADVVPANLLKLYIEFSEPMARGEAYQHLRIVDEAGKLVDNPFVEIDQELWDPAGRRLTVLFDPGRIKRGVKPNEDSGSPLVAGRRYRLVVAKGWRSAAGAALSQEAEKAFTAAPSERRPIVLAEWRITPPKAGTAAPLEVAFPRPLDSALAADSLHVQQAGETVAGHLEVVDQARRWRFTPQRPWRPGKYELQVETRIEDLAGNRIGRAFDVDTIAAPQARISKRVETLSFTVPG